MRSWNHGGALYQGLLRMDCNSNSRTDFLDKLYFLSTMPLVIVLYVAIIRVALWVVRPVLLHVMPRLKGRAFFSAKTRERTSALCIDVRTSPHDSTARLVNLRALLQVILGLIEVRMLSDRKADSIGGKWYFL